MKLSLAGSTLFDASAGLPPVDLRLNGVRVVEVTDFARATSKGVFFRGNTGSTITFSTSRVFASYADAQDAFWLAESMAPTQGPLLIRQTGAAADRPPVGAASAVLASVVPSLSLACAWTWLTPSKPAVSRVGRPCLTSSTRTPRKL